MPYTPFRNEETRSSILSALRDPAAQTAWGRFFDTYAGFIYGIARGEGLSEADADETVQNIMLELVRGGAAAHYDKSLGPFRGWLARLSLWRARNLRLRNLRRENAHEAAGAAEKAEIAATPTQMIDQGLEQVIEDEWMRTVTAAALDRLRAEISPAHFQAYYASAIEKMDAEAVSRLCGVTPNNLYQIRRRVGARFRAILEETMRDLDAPRLPPEANEADNR
jgi:RNA polymerase sigma-70 factor (ECF subfamily)